MIWVRFRKDQKVNVVGWSNVKNSTGIVVKDCSVAETTCLVYIDNIKREMWVPVKFIE